MDFTEIKKKRVDISTVSHFKKGREEFTLVEKQPDNSLQLWERIYGDSQACYEVSVPIKRSNGTMNYPSPEQFGQYGKCISPDRLDWALYLVRNGIPDYEHYLGEYQKWLQNTQKTTE